LSGRHPNPNTPYYLYDHLSMCYDSYGSLFYEMELAIMLPEFYS